MTAEAHEGVGSGSQRVPRSALGWFRRLAKHPTHYGRSARTTVHPLPWPAGFDPAASPVFARNSLEIPAAADAVFAVLVDATSWPSFYPNCADVKIEGGREPRLRAGSRFTWRTFATLQKSEVVLFEPNVSLGWTARCPGTTAFHRWVLEPTAGGTNVITEECQVGIVATLDRYWMNRSLRASHQIWLERMRDHLLGTSTKDVR